MFYIWPSLTIEHRWCISFHQHVPFSNILIKTIFSDKWGRSFAYSNKSCKPGVLLPLSAGPGVWSGLSLPLLAVLRPTHTFSSGTSLTRRSPSCSHLLVNKFIAAKMYCSQWSVGRIHIQTQNILFVASLQTEIFLLVWCKVAAVNSSPSVPHPTGYT